SAQDAHECINTIYLDIDISKAFDTVSHSKLLTELYKVGIRGKLYLWLKSYLINRFQYVQVGSELSAQFPASSGVPQGSKLGPKLFLVFMNDIEKVLTYLLIKLFADDAKLYYIFRVGTDLNVVQSDLDKVLQWSLDKELRLAFDKCFSMHIGHNNPCRAYSFGTNEIVSVTTCRDLGVLVSGNLKFSDHCLSLATEGFQKVHLIYSHFYSRNINFMKSLFSTYVKSKLMYASEVWSPHYIRDIDIIERVLRLFTRRLPGLSNLPYMARLRILEMKPLEECRIIADLTLVYKIIHGLVKLKFNDFFQYAPDSRTRGNTYKLAVNRSSLDCRKYFFSNRVVPIWNSLDDTIVCSQNLFQFKRRVTELRFLRFCRGSSIFAE
ncbi:MAG: reverse transcriptase domain-containing protein, partial [Pseudomonadota bacterium]